jgi:hypothetical protein
MLTMMLNAIYKGLWLVIQYVDKERGLFKLQVNIRNKCRLCIQVFKNTIKVNEKAPNFTSQTIEFTSLYDLMETNVNMTPSVMKFF